MPTFNHGHQFNNDGFITYLSVGRKQGYVCREGLKLYGGHGPIHSIYIQSEMI